MIHDRVFGSLPPTNHDWQIGKTAATIRMVNILEKQRQAAIPVIAGQLQEMISDLKSGAKTLDEVAASINLMKA